MNWVLAGWILVICIGAPLLVYLALQAYARWLEPWENEQEQFDAEERRRARRRLARRTRRTRRGGAG